MKKLAKLPIIALIMAVAVATAGNVFAANVTNLTYLHAVDGYYYQFDQNGTFIEQTDPPIDLAPGWLVLSSDDSAASLKGFFGDIVLQPKTILAIGNL